MSALYLILHTVDTFLVFFRAYRDEKGLLVYSLAKIRRNYIRSGWFFLNLLASFPGTLLSYLVSLKYTDEQLDDLVQNSDALRMVLFLFEMFKLLRLVRFKKLVTQSSIISRVSILSC
jgi:hypothetical protein